MDVVQHPPTDDHPSPIYDHPWTTMSSQQHPPQMTIPHPWTTTPITPHHSLHHSPCLHHSTPFCPPSTPPYLCPPPNVVWLQIHLPNQEVFTLLHKFLRIPPDSHWKVGIPWNSMEFLWKASGWSLSHLGFHFHGNSHFFPRNSDGNGRNPGASRNDSQWNHSIGILLKFRWNSVGNSFKVIVKNSTMVKN